MAQRSCCLAWSSGPACLAFSPGSTRPQEPQEGLGSGSVKCGYSLFQVDELHGHGLDSPGRWASWTPGPSDSGSEPYLPSVGYELQGLCALGPLPVFTQAAGTPRSTSLRSTSGSQPSPRGLQLCRGEASRSWVLSLLSDVPSGSPRASGPTGKAPGPPHGHF